MVHIHISNQIRATTEPLQNKTIYKSTYNMMIQTQHSYTNTHTTDIIICACVCVCESVSECECVCVRVCVHVSVVWTHTHTTVCQPLDAHTHTHCVPTTRCHFFHRSMWESKSDAILKSTAAAVDAIITTHSGTLLNSSFP